MGGYLTSCVIPAALNPLSCYIKTYNVPSAGWLHQFVQRTSSAESMGSYPQITLQHSTQPMAATSSSAPRQQHLALTWALNRYWWWCSSLTGYWRVLISTNTAWLSTTPDIKVEQGYKRVYIRVLKHHALEDWNMGFCIVIFIQSLFMVCRWKISIVPEL